MLEELHVRNLALVAEAWIEFSPGMTVLTGETGAGKTALLGGLKLLLGERADSTSVRSGASEALVEGRFFSAGEEAIVSRRVSADGRSRVTVGGGMATVGALAETIGGLVDLHGQHEHQALLASSTHVGYLDRSAGAPAAEALDAYRSARSKYREAVASLAALKAAIEDATADADRLRFTLQDIDQVAPLPGEDDELELRLPALQHAERLSEAADLAARELRGDGGATESVAGARVALDKVAGIDPRLDGIAARLGELEVLADDIGMSVRQYRDGIEHDPSGLEAAMQRLAALSGLKRKYGPSLDHVLEMRASAALALEAANDSAGVLAAAEAEVVRLEALLRSAADGLAEVRRDAAPAFCSALKAVADELAMSGASFEVSFTELAFESWTGDGPHRIEFLYAPGPGQSPRPLTKIASGGEISRVMLALKSVLGSADTVETLVFDEVDAGIGGATATAVGRRLRELSQDHQVIVVTHLAQVAVFADRHLVVSKDVSDDGVATSVRAVVGDERVAEIARMLSGNDSDASKLHAQELLESIPADRD